MPEDEHLPFAGKEVGSGLDRASEVIFHG
jgi:hypothetical protein